MKWRPPKTSPHHASLAMIGAKTGDRVLVVGAGDPGLAAELGRVTGLNGRTVVVDADPEARARIDQAAAQAGSLVEFESAPETALPLENGAVDVVLIPRSTRGLASRPVADRTRTVEEAARVVRPGGRVLIVEAAPQAGLRGLLRRAPGPTLSGQDAIELLQGAGLRAARVLGEVDGAVFVEATRARAT
jgi:ubiquinone/menaquinone biosynthesis C-methylase UbiE